MSDIFIKVILGHLVGDYLLQTRKMAINKTNAGSTGLMWSLIHCAVYTASVCLLVFDFSPLFVVAVFMTHWPIDRYHLGEKWLQMIGGRDLYSLYYSEFKYSEVTPATIIDLGFACVVYTVVDNTLHLLLLWLVINMFF